MSSLSKNTLYSFVNQFITIAIPFITFPYVSRVLGPESYGTVNFAISIVALFGIFGGIGLTSYATREVAKCKEDTNKLSKIFIEIFLIQSLLTMLVYIIYLTFIWVSNGGNKAFLLFFINGFTLFTNLFTFQWFFMGIENFKYITIRDAIVKICFVITIFLFIHESNDLILYMILNLISLILSAVLNCLSLLKKIKIRKYKLKFQYHFKAIILALTMSFISTLSIQLNPILLGSIATKENLGYYNVGLKLVTMAVSIISSALIVILPRLSYMNEKEDKDGQVAMVKKISDLLMLFSLPASLGLFLYSKSIVLILFGQEYVKAVNVSEITAICLIIMPLTGVLYNYIYSNDKEHIAIYTMIISLIVSICINILLVPKYLFIGAAICFVIVEFVKMVIYIFFVKKLNKDIVIFSFKTVQYIIVGLVTWVIPFIMIRPYNLIEIVLSIILSFILYISILIVFKNPYCLMLIKMVKTMIIKKSDIAK